MKILYAFNSIEAGSYKINQKKLLIFNPYLIKWIEATRICISPTKFPEYVFHFVCENQDYTAYINLCHVYKRFSEAMKTLVLFFPRHYGLTKRNLLNLGCLINNL